MTQTRIRPVRSTVRNADRHIAAREPFNAGSLRGDWYSYEPSIGRLPHDEVTELRRRIDANRDAGRATYVVYSYATPIAWSGEDGALVVPAVRYSQTTTQHQRACRAGAARPALVTGHAAFCPPRVAVEAPSADRCPVHVRTG